VFGCRDTVLLRMPSWEGWSRLVIYTSCGMNATQHTGLSSGLHDILTFLGNESRSVKISAPRHLRSKITNFRETGAVQSINSSLVIKESLLN